MKLQVGAAEGEQILAIEYHWVVTFFHFTGGGIYCWTVMGTNFESLCQTFQNFLFASVINLFSR